MQLNPNVLIEWLDLTPNAKSSDTERLLWVSANAQSFVLIAVGDPMPPKALPIWRQREEIESALEAKTLRVLGRDPYAPAFWPEEEISESRRCLRDAAWAVIQPLIEAGEAMFVRKLRGRLVREAVSSTGRHKKFILKHLRSYWQRGQVPNSLLPRFDLCGTPKQKTDQEATQDAKPKPVGKKRGPRSAKEIRDGQRYGVSVDEAILEKFRRGYSYYLKNATKLSLRDAYRDILLKEFNVGLEKQHGLDVPVPPPGVELPTFRQFQYWFEKEISLREATIAREGEKQFNLEHRSLGGSAFAEAFGPGSVFQIDSTPTDIHLISPLDGQSLIGRPTLYLVVDVFSWLIVGFCVTLDAPNYLGAILALENAFTDKVAYCASLKIEGVTEQDWPSHHRPEMLLADGGELEGYNSDHLMRAFKLRVAITAPYRADMKAIVERSFGIVNRKLVHRLPGAVRGQRKRGQPDPRRSARLTPLKFRQLMISCVLAHNATVRKNYRLNREMIADGVRPSPLELWRWGVLNRSGILRPPISPDHTRLHLLPPGEAAVKREGIRFKKLLYRFQRSDEEDWQVRASVRRMKRIPVAYDPRLVDYIYYRLPGATEAEVCVLNDKDAAFRGCDWHEVECHFKSQLASQDDEREGAYRIDALSRTRQAKILAEAEADFQATKQGLSDHARAKHARQNRKMASNTERKAEAWRLAQELEPVAPGHPSNVILMPTASNASDLSKPAASATAPSAGDTPKPGLYIPPANDVEELRASRARKWMKTNEDVHNC